MRVLVRVHVREREADLRQIDARLRRRDGAILLQEAEQVAAADAGSPGASAVQGSCGPGPQAAAVVGAPAREYLRDLCCW